jgi:hypothetical protein
MFFSFDVVDGVSNGIQLLGVTSADCYGAFLLKLQRKESAHVQFPIAGHLRF